MTNNSKTRGWSSGLVNRDRRRLAIRINHMRLAACDDDKVARAHGGLASLFECERSGATTEIMEQGVGALWQCQIPRVPELEMEEQGPTKANTIEHFGKSIHAPDVNVADDRTQYSDS